jgi:hypothetical protein
MPEQSILAFDIGIRNLAWCQMALADSSGAKPVLRGWQNYDLLAGAGHEAPKVKVTCTECSASATFWNAPAGPEKPTCQRHCPKSHPPLKDLSGAVLKRLPALSVLRSLAAASPIPPKKSATKAALLTLLGSRCSLPLEKPKLKKAVEHDLALMHDAIRTFVAANAESFRQSTHILLENQPVLKNPTMKTVQILLYATLRDLLQPSPPPLKLVHAGKKVQGKEKGDAGYSSRKEASEAAVTALLGAGRIADSTRWLTQFQAQAKKSDLADAFCMCCDALGIKTAG